MPFFFYTLLLTPNWELISINFIVMEIICPECYSEDAYFDGCTYVCNICGYCWGGDDSIFDE